MGGFVSRGGSGAAGGGDGAAKPKPTAKRPSSKSPRAPAPKRAMSRKLVVYVEDDTPTSPEAVGDGGGSVTADSLQGGADGKLPVREASHDADISLARIRQTLATGTQRIESLRFILADPSWRARLREHLNKMHAAESILFFDAVHEMLFAPPEKQADLARQIMNNFILDTAPDQVLLSNKVRDQLLAVYAARDFDLLAKSFKPAVDELFLDLKNSSGLASFLYLSLEHGNVEVHRASMNGRGSNLRLSGPRSPEALDAGRPASLQSMRSIDFVP